MKQSLFKYDLSIPSCTSSTLWILLNPPIYNPYMYCKNTTQLLCKCNIRTKKQKTIKTLAKISWTKKERLKIQQTSMCRFLYNYFYYILHQQNIWCQHGVSIYKFKYICVSMARLLQVQQQTCRTSVIVFSKSHLRIEFQQERSILSPTLQSYFNNQGVESQPARTEI